MRWFKTKKYIWVVHYKDDTTFKIRLSLCEIEIKKSLVYDIDSVRQVLINNKIPCGSKDTMITESNRQVEGCYKYLFI